MRFVHRLPMNLRQLGTFIAISDSGGVARAAGRLHLSQPAASRQLHALEDELGVALFHRIGRRLRLTSEGEDLLARCRRVLREVESLGESARALKRGERGILRVGATPQVIENLLAQFLERYQRRYPGVEVHLVEDGGARLPRRLERGEIQLAIMPSADETFPSRLLYPMHVVAVVASAHPLAGRAVVEVAELADERLLLLTREFASRLWFDATCQVARTRPRVLLESTVPQALLALARHGYGVAVVPTPVTVPEQGLRAVPVVHRGASIGRWAAVSWDAQRFLAPHAEAFIDTLAAQVRRGYPGRKLVRLAPPLPRPRGQRRAAKA
jgi:DNA-binding transcriptional LysR family regulator